MKDGLKYVIDKQIIAVVVAENDCAQKQHDDTPAPSTLEKVLRRDLDAWREAKAAIERARGR
jgi:hypothetical protein